MYVDTTKIVAIACAAYQDGLNDTLLENSDKDEILAVAKEGLLDSQYIESSSDVEVYVLRYPGDVVITFRGTDSLRDICEDAMFALCEWDGDCSAKVHEGIYRQYKSVEKELVEIVHKAKEDGLEVICTGHSSGAAIACFLATATGTHYYGFGAPKVGNAAFQALHDEKCHGKRSFMYINGSDCIPKLPPCPEYVHPSLVVRIGPRDYVPFLPTLGGLYYHSHTKYYAAILDKQKKKPGVIHHLAAFFQLCVDAFKDCMS